MKSTARFSSIFSLICTRLKRLNHENKKAASSAIRSWEPLLYLPLCFAIAYISLQLLLNRVQSELSPDVVLTIRGSKSGRLLLEPPMKMAASGTRHCVNAVQTCILHWESTTVRVHVTLFSHRKSEQRGFAQHTIIAPRSTWDHRILCRLA
jgi:hypothetical protein